jgi:hypothetical protein
MSPTLAATLGAVRSDCDPSAWWASRSPSWGSRPRHGRKVGGFACMTAMLGRAAQH